MYLIYISDANLYTAPDKSENQSNGDKGATPHLLEDQITTFAAIQPDFGN